MGKGEGKEKILFHRWSMTQDRILDGAQIAKEKECLSLRFNNRAFAKLRAEEEKGGELAYGSTL